MLEALQATKPPAPRRRAAELLAGVSLLAALALPRDARAQSAEAGADPGQAQAQPPRLIDAPAVEAPPGVGPDADLSAVLELEIDAAGAVTGATLLRASGVAAADERVLEAARHMRFEPARVGGQPVSVRIRFRYRLRPAVLAPTPQGGSMPGPTVPAAVPSSVPASPARTTARGGTRRPRREPDDANGVTVRVRYEPGAATRMTFRAEELTTVPGTFGEPTRIVASQPGVARTPFGLGYFLVRGASFENTGFFVDGFPVLILYHLAAGPAVISSRLVGQLDFYPGGYPLQYGRFSAGVISLETRPPPTDRPRAEAEIDVFRASLLGVLPFDHGRGSIAVAARRSYYDLILPLIQPGVTVNYTDGQIRADYAITPRLRASAFIFGSSDNFDRTEAVGAGASLGESRDGLVYNFIRGIAKLEYRAPGGVLAQLSGMLGWDETKLITTDPGRPDRGLSASGNVFGERMSVRIPHSPALTTTVGLDALGYVYDVGLAYPSPAGFAVVPPPQSNPRVANISAGVTQFGVAAYAEEVLRAAPLEITSGVRFELMRYSGNTHLVADPRAVARLRLVRETDAVPGVRNLILIAATGIFHQPPPFFGLVPQAGNPDLLPQRAWQSSVGVEGNFAHDLEARVTGFYSRMWQLPRQTYEYVMTSRGPMRALALSDGEGQSYGLEVLVRRKLGDSFTILGVKSSVYGWLAYTLSRSERFLRDPVTGQIGRVVPFTYDQTHILNVAVSWDIADRFRVGARFQVATGSVTNAITGAVYDADADGYRPQYVSEADRLPTYHQLDIRLDYLFHAGPLDMSVYLDVLNVYNQQNSEGWVYQYDYADRRPRPGMPILPTLGVRGTL